MLKGRRAEEDADKQKEEKERGREGRAKYIMTTLSMT